ncbi:putative proline-rich receptor-like protein kinase PERK6 [Panicum virgatum]|uniref:putative proline-rich receptor-like protein kinase PERK6 n=1 Tax=Panicum virgatum TaxID=38727 RepID=UPI0019D59395|nr:putative proline-rich receptor-like protein kinase PERK6 [Panicum virgatum]
MGDRACGAGAAVRRQLTDRSDVYSFGVLLVELASARRPIETKREMKERLTARWAMARFIGGAAADVLDPHLARTPAAERALEMLLELAFRCMESLRSSAAWGAGARRRWRAGARRRGRPKLGGVEGRILAVLEGRSSAAWEAEAGRHGGPDLGGVGGWSSPVRGFGIAGSGGRAVGGRPRRPGAQAEAPRRGGGRVGRGWAVGDGGEG